MALQHLRSSTADKRPTPGAMSDGQLALNTNLVSPGLFFKDSNGDSVKVGPVHVGTTAPNVSPGVGGQAGNSKGEQWLDTSSSRYVFKIWDGTAWRTEDGEFVNASGDTMTGALVMDNQQPVRFRETTVNGTNFIAIQAPASVASDRTLTLPDVTGTIVSTGDTGSVTSTMILDGTIVNADINASAAIAHTKLANITAGSVLLGNASDVPTATALSGDVTVSDAGVTAIGSGVIVDADVNASAAIAGTKISPDFGGQNVVTTGNLQGASINGGAIAGMRNRIINGGMDIAQRGTSFAAAAAGTYSMDRWSWQQVGAMVCTVSQSTDVPNNTFQSSYKIDVTTVDSSIAADDRASIQQTIEGYNVRDLIGTTFTLSFWVKSPKTGTHCIAFRNALDRSHVKEYTIISANSWEYKTLTVTGGLITAGTWNWTNGQGLNLVFTLACGSTFHTTADAWQTGNFIATANQVNVMDNTANDFFITGVQLEPGAVATPFERRIFGQELALCQRYFEAATFNWQGAVSAASGYAWDVVYKITKRVAPALTFSGGSASNFGTSTAANITIEKFSISASSTASQANSFNILTWTASAEL
jgi:hypothetical protein